MWGPDKGKLEKFIENEIGFIALNRGRWEEIPGLIIQATLRHVYEEGERPCPHNLQLSDRPAYKRECGWCWAELKKEAGL